MPLNTPLCTLDTGKTGGLNTRAQICLNSPSERLNPLNCCQAERPKFLRCDTLLAKLSFCRQVELLARFERCALPAALQDFWTQERLSWHQAADLLCIMVITAHLIEKRPINNAVTGDPRTYFPNIWLSSDSLHVQVLSITCQPWYAMQSRCSIDAVQPFPKSLAFPLPSHHHNVSISTKRDGLDGCIGMGMRWDHARPIIPKKQTQRANSLLASVSLSFAIT